jgi:hypothetical protein
MRLESVIAAILQAPAELAPEVGCAGVWMYNAAENHVQDNHCVDACLCISHALEVFGIGSRIERVLEINQLGTVTKEVIEAARESLVIGVM